MKAFLVGLSAGAAIGVMVAPDKGSNTRRRLRAQGNDIAQFAREQSAQLKNIVRNPEAAMRSVKETLGPRVEQAVEKSVDAARFVASKLGIGSLSILNTVDRERLMEVEGIGPVLADRIIDSRPYSSPQELIERGILAEATFKNLERQLLKRA